MYEVRVFFIEMKLAESVIYQWRAPQSTYIYIQSTTVHCVCPLVGIGTLLHPLVRQRVRGWGSPNSDDFRKSLALCGELAR
jgi:hypothetical protein